MNEVKGLCGYVSRKVGGERPTLSFDWLCKAMKTRQRVSILGTTGNVICGIIGSIQAEDGSGKCWNVKVDGTWVFVRAE